MLLVDLPFEHAADYRRLAMEHGMSLIPMTAPGSDEARLTRILEGASGFIYHVSVNGITGGSSRSAHELTPAVAQIRRHSPLPVALGFGIRSEAQLAQLQGIADLLVVGSALVQTLCEEGVDALCERVRSMASVLAG